MENFEKETGERAISEESMTVEQLADALDDLQKDKNDGRGVSCVQEIVMWLRRGDIERARAVATHDADKIHDALGKYRDIEDLIKAELFQGEDEHPWSLSERLGKLRE